MSKQKNDSRLKDLEGKKMALPYLSCATGTFLSEIRVRNWDRTLPISHCLFSEPELAEICILCEYLKLYCCASGKELTSRNLLSCAAQIHPLGFAGGSSPPKYLGLPVDFEVTKTELFLRSQ
ncbi:hypothetical protein NE237_003366 [Protea cynaroides]|uniref:Uncharacterized protein n=1 Tax=Protea cynaroides TaxID=273540 RepID=A0A9Q0KGV3_9MAGN|nr:hypothetical protein NE237_003366 [Protea cynaroides]